MTIYAIANNIISPVDSSYSSKPIWTIISPSGILQGGNPYFVPDFAERFEARTALAIKIGKVGKGIASRFVGRYAVAAAPCVLFLAADLLQSLRVQGLPWTPAISYDRCLAIGQFFPFALDDKSYEIRLSIESGESHLETIWNDSSISPGIENSLVAISRDNTLKTGDLILMGLSQTGPVVSPESRAILSINDVESLKFNIR